jgi:hypothetical protein
MSEALPLASGAGAAAVVERLAARQQQLAAEREQRYAQLQVGLASRYLPSKAVVKVWKMPYLPSVRNSVLQQC